MKQNRKKKMIKEYNINLRVKKLTLFKDNKRVKNDNQN